MKNHAILIQTHANLELLKMVVKRMEAPNHFFFIHVDGKSKNYNEFLSIASTHVIFTNKRYNVRWGSVEQIYLTLELIRTAVAHQVKFDYFHLISGQDFPTKSNSGFDEVFEDVDKSFMELDRETPIYDRFMYFHLNGLFDLRSKWGRRFETYSLKLQKKVGRHIRLRPSLPLTPYKGDNWWSLNNSSVEYVLNYLKKNPHYLKRFRFTRCCDEVFFHTILFNSPLKKSIELNDLRYVDWNRTYDYEPLPRTLVEKDFNSINDSKSVFCRKIDINKSRLLLNRINLKI